MKIRVVMSFGHAESGIVEQQLQILEQILALPMSSTESQTMKPLIEVIDKLLREWMVFDKDLKGDEYALKRMLVIFAIKFSVRNVDF